MPITKHKDQRVGVFIDTQNLYHSAKISTTMLELISVISLKTLLQTEN